MLCSVPAGLLGLNPLLWKAKQTHQFLPEKQKYPPRPIIGFTDSFRRYQLIGIDIHHIGIGTCIG